MIDNIKELVERFQNRINEYCSSQYKEVHLRQEFIDRFFEALGWDMYGERATSFINREVILEDKVKIEGKSKAPDYGFYINAKRQFFLEAKRASLDIFSDKESAFQLRRYGWSASLPISILTNFRQLAIYDCRIKPEREDFASKARIAKFGFEEYVERWGEIYLMLSREAVQNGSLITLLEKEKLKSFESQPVDEAFLAEIEDWRMALARNISERNDLEVRDLNFAVQAIINRLIFLRLCEDKGIEPYGRLLEIAKSKQIYKKLSQFFKQADKRYNAGLFHFSEEQGRTAAPDKWTLSLQIDDKYLRRIIQSIYDQDEKKISYEFSVIPIEILGHIYEKFLGKVIVLGKGQHPQIEEKPEVKKAGGVYYTPEYIVNYIVENTVGKLLENKTPDDVSKLSILDPACGSGSFLIGAYSYLLDWHLNYYSERPEEYKNVIFKITENTYQLTSPEKKRILLNNIYGVDIDQQAVEISKLSLLLKVLEGETQKSIDYQLKLEKARALPDLDNNIKCGNSLISNDFYENEQNDPENEELRYRINAFDWEEEFVDIMGSGGFDVVIGNPPYLYSAGQNYPDYFNKNYQLKQYQTDFYVYFIERAISLCHKEGKLSFIVPDSWLNSQHFSKVRNHLLTKHKLDKILIFDYLVFKGVTLENSIFILSIAAQSSQFPIDCLLKSKKLMTLNTINPKKAVALGLINPRMSRNLERVLRKIEQGAIFLEDKVKINRGIHAYRTDGYGKSKFGAGYQIRRDKDEESYHADMPLDETYLLEIKGKHLNRYTFKDGGKYLSYGNWLAEARTPEFFFQPKITLRKILSIKLHGTFFEEAVALDQSLYIMISKNNDTEELKHILGILLSKIGAWYLKQKYAIYDQLYPWYTKKQLSVFPIKEKSELMIKLVNQMLILHQQLNDATSNHKKETIQRQINRTDKSIDQLVYELYDLTPDDIAIVEEATQK